MPSFSAQSALAGCLTHGLASICVNRRLMLGLSATLGSSTRVLADDATGGSEDRLSGGEVDHDFGQSDRTVISIFLRGGFSHVDSLDPKPDSTADQPFSSIQTRTPGTVFSELFPLLADRSNRLTVIRSLTHRESDHDPGQRYWRTGRTDAGSEDPSLGAVVAYRNGWRVPPAYVAIPSVPPDAGFLGASFTAYNAIAPGGGGQMSSTAPADATGEQRLRRHELLNRLGHGLSRAGAESTALKSLTEAQRRAVSLGDSPMIRDLADFSGENAAVVRGYGDSELGRYLIMARRLAMGGSRFIQVEAGQWDHHVDLVDQFRRQAIVVDRAIAGLMDDLNDRGMLEKVLVMVSTEFGRSPHFEGPAARPGRGHWPAAYSALMFGAGLAGGNVIGATDRHGATVIDGGVSPADIWRTSAEWMGLDLSSPELLPDGRKLNVGGRSLI